MFHRFLNSPQQNSTYSKNYQNYSCKHLNQSRLFGVGRLMKGVLILPLKDFEKRVHKRRTCLKYSSLRCKNYSNLNYTLAMSYFYIMSFNEKICKIKAFNAYPTLEI